MNRGLRENIRVSLKVVSQPAVGRNIKKTMTNVWEIRSCSGGRADRRMGGRMDGWMDQPTDGRTDGLTD